MGDQEPEPDWEKNFSESFTKKIPFPMFKYEVCKFNPAKTDSMYTLATASVHDNTNFNLYTSADTKKELDEIVKELKEEDAKEIKEVKEETKEEKKEEKKEGEGEGDAGGYQDEEPKKEKIKDSNDPVERALRILNNKRAEEKEANNIKHDRRESRKEDLDIPEPSLNKKASSNKAHNAEKKESKLHDDNLTKGREKSSFEKVDIDDTFYKNLINCK